MRAAVRVNRSGQRSLGIGRPHPDRPPFERGPLVAKHIDPRGSLPRGSSDASRVWLHLKRYERPNDTRLALAVKRPALMT